MDDTKEKRGIFTRVCISVLWLIPIVVVTHMLVGAVVGGLAGSDNADFDAGYKAGQRASEQFFITYGKHVFSIEVLMWLVLSYFGILPGTSKYKQKK